MPAMRRGIPWPVCEVQDLYTSRNSTQLVNNCCVNNALYSPPGSRHLRSYFPFAAILTKWIFLRRRKYENTFSTRPAAPQSPGGRTR